MCFGTSGRFFKRDFQVVPQVRPALRSAASSSATLAKAEDVAEPPEDVLEAGEHRRIKPSGCGAAKARMSEPIVHVSLVGIRENAVRFGRRLELLFGALIARIAIGVMFQRQLSIRALDGLVVCGLAYAQDLVVVALTHPWPPSPSRHAEDVRQACSPCETPP